MDGSWSGFAGDLLIKDELPHHTAVAARDIILNNAVSLDAALAEGRYKQIYLVHFGKILGRARHIGGCYALRTIECDR